MTEITQNRTVSGTGTGHSGPPLMGTGHAAHDPLLTRTEKFSYGSGEIASNLAWNMVTGFLVFYYSDVAGISLAALGTLMLAARALDAVFDLMVGVLVDRGQSRHGRARPYLLYMPLPFVALFVLTFSIGLRVSIGNIAL